MRTRMLMVIIVVSLAANLAMGTALWSAWRTAQAATTRMPTVCPELSSEEERQVREQLGEQLCSRAPDRAAIEATLARLDAVRATKRREVVDRWLSRWSGASDSERARLRQTVTKLLCPWHVGSNEGGCAPSSAPGSGSDNRAQPNDTRRTQ